jgi:hypothetical protein
LKESSPVDINQEREALTSSTRLNGLRAHPIADTPSSTIELPPMSPVSIKSNRSKIAGQARDARTGGDSVRDIADFLRSTGPPGSASQPSASPTASLNGSLRTQYRNTSGSVVKSSSKSMVDHSPKKSQDPNPSVGGGLRLQTPSTEDDRGEPSVLLTSAMTRKFIIFIIFNYLPSTLFLGGRGRGERRKLFIDTISADQMIYF